MTRKATQDDFWGGCEVTSPENKTGLVMLKPEAQEQRSSRQEASRLEYQRAAFQLLSAEDAGEKACWLAFSIAKPSAWPELGPKM